MRLTRIHQVAARAGEDVEALTAFYRDVLEARYIGTFDPPWLVFFDFNGTRILFEAAPDAAPAALYFWVDDIDAAHEELTARGVDFSGAPHLIHRDEDGTFDNPGYEEWMAFFEDPAGNTLAIATRR